MGALWTILAGPLLLGVINRTKAVFAGRRGAPLWQPYLDAAKLLQKGAVYSRTTTWLFRAGPVVGLASVLAAAALLPLGRLAAPLAFPGDVVLFAYVLAVGRLFTVLAALDTGSAFEGMGASREVQFAALAEPATLVALAALARISGSWSLSDVLAAAGPALWAQAASPLLLVAVALLFVLLVENARIPFDDPTTHLELTMIHEAMVLDHSGPELAAIELGAMLKLWLFAGLLASVAFPLATGAAPLDALAHAVSVLGLGVGVGLVESAMARLPLLRVPQMLLAIALLALGSMLLAPELTR
jgi:formate hydrogenlyase subunit 4